MSLDLVTGGCGFIGSHLVDRLVEAGRKVRVLDDLSVGRKANIADHIATGRVEFLEGSVSEADCVSQAMKGVQRVFHLAARADIVPSIVDPEVYYRSNVDGTYEVVKAAREAGVERLLYAASSSCYGIPDTYPTPENAEIRPQYPYALTKYLGEQIVLHWAQVYGIPSVCLRLFNVYGPRARTSGTYGAVFGVFLAQLLAGKPLTIVGDGTQTRDFTFVEDVVDAFMMAAESDVHAQTMNVGSRNPTSVNRIAELLGASETVNIPKRPGEPDCTWADVQKIERLLGWSARTPIETGVARMLENMEWWRDAPVWTPDRIAEATEDWFRYLGNEKK